MNLPGIEVFLAIVETQSLSGASKKLFISQSTVSHRLSSLEEDLDTILIKRGQGQRFITLTPKGEEFLPIAKRWVCLKRDTNNWVTMNPELKLNIGSVDSLNTYVFTPLFRELTTNGLLSLKVSSHWTNTLFILLENMEIDIALLSRIYKSNTLVSEPIFSEKMVLISSAQYSNFGDVVHPEELNPRKELFLDWGAEYQVWHDYWWDPTNPINLIVDTSGLIFKCIDIPDSWSIVTLAIANSYKDILPIKISELSNPPPDRIIYKAKHRNLNPNKVESLKIFEKHLYEFVKDNPLLQKI